MAQAEGRVQHAVFIAGSTELHDLLAQALARRGWTAQVTTADAALAALRAQQHDSLLIDLQTLGPSGTDLIRRIRQDEDLACMPVTAHAPYAGVGEMALAAGADDTLVAPCVPSHLLSRLAACVAQKERDP